MKPTSAPWLVVVASLALAGCATTAPSASPTPEPLQTVGTRQPIGTEQLCNSVLANQTLLAWVPATIADFHAYQYGGPRANVPLRTAFPGLDETAAGAWCGVKAGKDSIAWWAVVDGQLPEHAITITGPGSGKYVGETTQGALVVP